MYDWLPNWLGLDKNGTAFKMPAYDKPDANSKLYL